MNSIAKKNAADPHPKNLGTETVGFLAKKIKGIYVENIISWIIAVVFMCCTATAGSRAILKMIAESVPGELFLLRMTGLACGAGGLNAPVWYISSMLIAMAIMYPMIRKWENISCSVIIPLASLMILGCLIYTTGDVFNIGTWIGITFKGNLRAFSEIGIGVMCWRIVQKIRKWQTNRAERIAVTAVKWMCYGIVIAWMYTGTGKLDIICLLMLALAIIISFSEKGIDKNLYNNKLCIWLGKFSMPLYFSHFFYTSSLKELANLNNILPSDMANSVKFGVYLLCSFTSALFVMAASGYIRRVINSRFLTGK